MPNWIPEGWHSVTCRLVVSEPKSFVAFLEKAFAATGEFCEDSPSQMKIGNSIVMVSASGPRRPTASFLYVYVDDADATYERALRAGAVSIEAPLDTFYGDRRAMITDPCGNDWQIATYRSR